MAFNMLLHLHSCLNDWIFLKFLIQAMLVHPDKNMGSPLASESFKKLQCAYDVRVFQVFLDFSYFQNVWGGSWGAVLLTMTFIFRFFLTLWRSRTMMSNSEWKNLRLFCRNLLALLVRYEDMMSLCAFSDHSSIFRSQKKVQYYLYLKM